MSATPFNLKQVRLLDGPFKSAMLLDQQYLLALDPERLLNNFRVTAGLPSAARPQPRPLFLRLLQDVR